MCTYVFFKSKKNVNVYNTYNNVIIDGIIGQML